VSKLIESTLISLNGVTESPDRWAVFDQEAATAATTELDKSDAFLFGRVGYQRLRELWEPVSGNPYVAAINAKPKYVASNSLNEVGWNATLLNGDVAAEVERLKSDSGQDLIKYGTGRIDATLFEAELIDELRLWVMPVVVGSGRRLLDHFDASRLRLELLDVTRFANGSAIMSYRPTRVAQADHRDV
jgi:dihydrofolate reductase